ncbi:MAG: hypothetical protein JETT_2064 [Candidatus Jettenia ecosi]|uniref:Uncharacterized protein n=1 Tax=Candidatus Jettenia ecosi TaxID=2494326 RepID=A0A533QAJ3_9BACT|nr:MAG: hypothetical protein JETT_2064 [Candidatus Jettenia ecosi]
MTGIVLIPDIQPPISQGRPDFMIRRGTTQDIILTNRKEYGYGFAQQDKHESVFLDIA